MVYPGLPPNVKHLHQTGGMYRTCLVVELVSLAELGGDELDLIAHKLAATLSSLGTIVDKSKVVKPDDFDNQLRNSLRI